MRTELVPDALWEETRPLLPAHPPSPKGGRPRVPDRACLAALLYLLREGGTYRGLPCRELGCGPGRPPGGGCGSGPGPASGRPSTGGSWPTSAGPGRPTRPPSSPAVRPAGR
ncbi:transposase [bacterium]|nr:transposase [bacterium]